MAADTPPRGREVGSAAPGVGVTPWSSIAAQTRERVPELRWPRNVATYDRMLSTDAQVWGLYAGTVMPLTQYAYWIDPNGNDEAMVAPLAEDVGLPVGEPEEDGREALRPPGALDFSEHLAEALFAPPFGHYYFEMAGDFEESTGLWRLDTLGPRHPSTLTEVRTTESGALDGIRQQAGLPRSGGLGAPLLAIIPPLIPAGRLVPYVWQPDSVNRWLGRSILRPLYRNWLVKDVLIRVDATNHRRAGGVPWIKTDERFEGANLDDLQALAAQFEVDEEGGAALPPGAELMLARIMGTNIVESLRYHDEQMAKVWQAMVRELGQTATGSRALGETFSDLEAMARRAVAEWFARTFTRWVLARWWLWNHGETRFPPILRYRPPEIEGSDAPEEGSPNPPRAAAGRPSPRPSGAGARREDPPRVHGRASTLAGSGHQRHVTAALSLPDRDLRREPYPHEVTAAVDFAAMDVAYADAAERLTAMFLDEWLPTQVQAVSDAITTTSRGTPRVNVRSVDMARVRAPVTGGDDLAAVLLDVTQSGIDAAVAELAAQGLDITPPSPEAVTGIVRDHAAAVAQQVADGLSIAASRRAVQLTGERTAAQVAAETGTYLHGLEHRWERDQLAGAVQQATNAGRLHVFEQVENRVTPYASELLDAATCDACAAVDGHDFASMAEARRYYPSGGYYDCAGGPRCRGTVVVVVDE